MLENWQFSLGVLGSFPLYKRVCPCKFQFPFYQCSFIPYRFSMGVYFMVLHITLQVFDKMLMRVLFCQFGMQFDYFGFWLLGILSDSKCGISILLCFSYKTRFLASLLPSRRAGADFTRPVFVAVAFYLCAKKHKVSCDWFLSSTIFRDKKRGFLPVIFTNSYMCYS